MRFTRWAAFALVATILSSSCVEAGCCGRAGNGPLKRLFGRHQNAAATVIVMPEGPEGPALVHQVAPVRSGFFQARPGQLQVQSVMEFRPQASPAAAAASSCTCNGCQGASR